MLNSKKFFNKKTITLLTASLVIIALLIVVVATGWINNTVACPDCSAVVKTNCITCDGSNEITCADWKTLLTNQLAKLATLPL